MPKRFTDGNFALGLILGGGTVLIAAFLGNPPDNFPNQNPQTNHASDNAPKDERWWLIGRVVYMDDTLAQWIMMLATIAAAYLLLRTLWATQRMTREAERTTKAAIATTTTTREIGEKQVRAYLSITKVSVIVHIEDPFIWLHFRVFVRNTGQSPATDVTVKIGLNKKPEIGAVRIALGDLDAGIEVSDIMPQHTHPDALNFIDDENTTVEIEAGLFVEGYDVFGNDIERDGWFGRNVKLIDGSETELPRSKMFVLGPSIKDQLRDQG